MDNLGEIRHRNYSEKIINHLINSPFYENSNTIMCFISFGNEVHTHEFIKNSIIQGKKLVVPITKPKTKELMPSYIKDFNELELGHYNILTPRKEFIRPIKAEKIDLIIVPGVVFDRQGYRIGYGGGYYDRFLSTLLEVDKISIAFDLQVVDKVPREDFDIAVDYIFTEKEIVQCE